MERGLAWLDAMVGVIRCASCRALYTREDLRVVGQREGYVFVRCECHSCRREGIAVVLVEVAPTERPGRRTITVDDVLSAHEILAGYDGNAEGLFAAEGQRPF